MKNAVISTIVLGAVATLGDWIWARFLAEHLAVAGVIHGALLCLAMGAMAARPFRQTATGAAIGLAIGAAAAGIFYVLAPIMRYGAMFLAWFGLWVMLGALCARLAHASQLRVGVTRGLIAGTASGLAFFLVSDMWTQWNPRTINYLDHFARWAFAFAPGFLVLQGGRPSVASGQPYSRT